MIRDPFTKIERKDCAHKQIQFGSGDYYIYSAMPAERRGQ